MKQLKVGLIGLGRIGKVHLENIIHRMPLAKVCAVADPIAESHTFAKSLGIHETYQDADQVISNPEIDAIIICSPTNTHLDFIKKAAAFGKHIFCEKPLELSLSKIEDIRSCVEKQGIKLQVGFNRRFDANFMAVKRKVTSGAIGEAQILKITSRDPGPPPIEYIKVSGGMFMDMTIHDFDMARFIVGSEVDELTAKAGVLVDKAIGEVGDIDTAIIVLKFVNGCFGIIDNSRKAVYGYDQRLEIFGSKGMSKIVNNYPNTEVFFDENGGHSAPPLDFFMERYKESYLNEMDAFVKAIIENKPVSVDCNDALMATKIALAAQQSLKENQTVFLDSI